MPPPRPLRRLPPFLFGTSAVLVFAACGGTSVKHVSGDDDAGQGGTTGGSSATGGTKSSGGKSTTGGTGGTTGGTGGSGNSPATGGSAATVDCENIRFQADNELANIRRCMTDAECGQVIDDSSCGCALDLVARLDADTSAFRELLSTSIDGEQCVNLGSNCDCPKTDGFECAEGRCGYRDATIPDPVCTPATMGSMCVIGVPMDSGDALHVGMPLTLAFRPFGCFSSSCTSVVSASCAAKPAGDDFYATADMCLSYSTDPEVGCTADCSGAYLDCPTEYLLTGGTHTVRFEGEFTLEVTFTVPSVVNDGSLCAAMDF